MNDPLQILYSSLFRLNQRCRGRNRKTFALPVISVGGLTAGGSGKTPAVIMIAEILQQEGYRPIVATRGYRGGVERKGLVLYPGGIRPDPEVVGDEPAMIADSLRSSHIVIGRDRRSNLSRFLRENPELHQRGIILLDDGFQHLQVERDCDVLLLDEETLHHGKLLPRGRLREPLEGACRADIILLRSDEALSQTEVAEIVRYKLPYLPGTIVSVQDVIENPRHVRLGTGLKTGRRTLLVTGVAQPDRILAMLRQIGVVVVEELQFDDHHRYRQRDVDRMLATMNASGAQAIVTTGKDSVKLRRFRPLDSVLHTIPHRLVPIDPDSFRRALRERCLS